MSGQSDVRRHFFLLLVALFLALASTVGIRAYYRAAHLDVASGMSPRIAWFLASFVLALIVGLIVQRVVDRFHLSTSARLASALAAMTIAVLAMVSIECILTWPDRPILTTVTAARHLECRSSDAIFGRPDCAASYFVQRSRYV
jgi:hypothetical protein